MSPKQISDLIGKINSFAKKNGLPCSDDLGTDESSLNRKVEGLFFGGIRAVKGKTDFTLIFRVAYEKFKTENLFLQPIVDKIMSEFAAVSLSHTVSDNLHVLIFECMDC